MARTFSIVQEIARADAARGARQDRVNAEQDRQRLLKQNEDILARKKIIQGRQDAAFAANQSKFGDVAGNPQAFSQLSSATARDKAFEAQQKDKEQARMLSASTNAVKLLTQARDSGGNVLETFDRLAPLFPQLGIDPAQVAPFRDAIAQDPSILDTLAAGLLDQGKRTLVSGKFNGERATGFVDRSNTFNPVEGFVADQKGGSGGAGDNRAFKQETIGSGTAQDPFRTRLTFSDGSTQILQGKPTAALLASGRLGVQQERINPGAAGALAASKEGEKATVKRLDAGLGNARTAEIAVQNLERQKELITEGIRTGSLSEARQGAARFFQDILGIPDDQVSTTDEFFALAGSEVAQQIQAFGSGTGLSDADREFAKKIVGGSQAIDIEAIRRLVDMRIKVNKKTINDFNKDRDSFVSGSRRLAGLFPRVGGDNIQQTEKPVTTPDLTDAQTKGLDDAQLLQAILGN